MNFKKFAELCEMELDDFLSDMFTGTGYAINAKNEAVQSRNQLRSQYPDAWLLYNQQ